MKIDHKDIIARFTHRTFDRYIFVFKFVIPCIKYIGQTNNTRIEYEDREWSVIAANEERAQFAFDGYFEKPQDVTVQIFPVCAEVFPMKHN